MFPSAEVSTEPFPLWRAGRGGSPACTGRVSTSPPLSRLSPCSVLAPPRVRPNSSGASVAVGVTGEGVAGSCVAGNALGGKVAGADDGLGAPWQAASRNRIVQVLASHNDCSLVIFLLRERSINLTITIIIIDRSRYLGRSPPEVRALENVVIEFHPHKPYNLYR